ncbi:retrovirus-related pol polyprotein from transposon TNT 1-94 [Tanacetum coccineum]
MVTRFHVGTNKKKSRYNCHVSTISLFPKSYTIAIKDPNWQRAMLDEYNALIKNNTWVLLPRLSDAKIVRSMWLFKHKHFADESLCRYKARLAANEVGSLYGLKQASRAWFQRFATYATRIVQQVCLYMHDPREPHLAAINRILQYVRDTLDTNGERVGIRNCHSCRTPVDTKSKLGDDDALISDPTLYRSLVGVHFKWERSYKLLLKDAEETDGALSTSPERSKSLLQTFLRRKERYKADIRAKNILLQSFKHIFLKWNNQLRSFHQTQCTTATVQDGRVVVQDVRGRYNANNQGRPFQRNNARGNVEARNAGGQNRDGNVNPGQAKPIMCYNCKGIRHIARESAEQITNFDKDVDDLALQCDSLEADQCDAFDSDVDEAPTTQTMFMVNLSSEDPIYDEAGPSYDSNTPFEYVVNSDADYTSDSNIIPYDQVYKVEDTREISEITKKRMLEKMKRPQRKKRDLSPKPLQQLTGYPPKTPGQARVQTALFKEVKVMEEIFDQMNDEVDQNTVDKQCAEIERKNLLIANENLIANCLSNQLLVELEEIKQHYKELFESIQITRASTNEKTSSLLTQIEDLKAQLEGNLKVAARSSVKTKVLAPETVREIIEEARVVKPLDNVLNYACQYTKLSELVEYLSALAQKNSPKENSKAPSIPLN